MSLARLVVDLVERRLELPRVAVHGASIEPIGVAKSPSHHQSQTEIDGDNHCSQHLSRRALDTDYRVDRAYGFFLASVIMLAEP